MYIEFKFENPNGSICPNLHRSIDVDNNKEKISGAIHYIMGLFYQYYNKQPNRISMTYDMYEILRKLDMTFFDEHNNILRIKHNDVFLFDVWELLRESGNKIIFSYKEEKKPEPKPEYSNTYKREFKNVHIQFKYIDKPYEYRTIHTHPADMLDNQLEDIIDTFLNEKPYYKKPNSISISSDLYRHFERRNKITKVGVIEKLFNKYNIISKLDSEEHPYTIMLSYQMTNEDIFKRKYDLKASYSIKDSYYNSLNNTNKPSVSDSLKKKINQPKTFDELVDYIIHTEYFKNIKNELEKEDPYFKIFGTTEQEFVDYIISELKEIKSDKSIKELASEILKESTLKYIKNKTKEYCSTPFEIKPEPTLNELILKYEKMINDIYSGKPSKDSLDDEFLYNLRKAVVESFIRENELNQETIDHLLTKAKEYIKSKEEHIKPKIIISSTPYGKHNDFYDAFMYAIQTKKSYIHNIPAPKQQPKITINDVINLQPNPDILIPILKSNILNLDLLNIKNINLSGKYIHAIKWLCSNFKLTLNVIDTDKDSNIRAYYIFRNGKLLSEEHHSSIDNDSTKYDYIYLTDDKLVQEIITKNKITKHIQHYFYDQDNRLTKITQNGETIESVDYTQGAYDRNLLFECKYTKDNYRIYKKIFNEDNLLVRYNDNIHYIELYYTNTKKFECIKKYVANPDQTFSKSISYKYSYNSNNILSQIKITNHQTNGISKINFSSDNNIIKSCSFSDYTTNNQNSFIINSYN